MYIKKAEFRLPPLLSIIDMSFRSKFLRKGLSFSLEPFVPIAKECVPVDFKVPALYGRLNNTHMHMSAFKSIKAPRVKRHLLQVHGG